MKNDFLQDLKWRGLVKDISNEEKIRKAQSNGQGIYAGFDPTADSLHVGHLILITLLKRASDFSLQPIALLGGGTGMIGDPSFKNLERVLLSKEKVGSNIRSIKKQLDFMIPNVTLLNNKDWLSRLKLIDFLRDIGKTFKVPYLLSKEAIAKRLGYGLSVTEFLYPMLQAYDFFWLYENKNCRLQVGGSDQWGNITSGLDLISNQQNDVSEAAGFTVPLLLQKNGEKFGKTSLGNTIWLSSKKTTPYLFYQFWFLQTDDEAHKLLKYLTFLTRSQISEIYKEHKRKPKARILQLKLAGEMTKFVHGEENYKHAKELSEYLFSDSIDISTKEVWKKLRDSLGTTTVRRTSSVLTALRMSGATSSLRETLEFVKDGSLLINNKKVVDFNERVIDFRGSHPNRFLVKKGKKNYFLWEIE